MELETLLSVDEAAVVLNVSPRTVYEWAERGLIAHHKLGRLLRFSIEDLTDFITNARKEARVDVS